MTREGKIKNYTGISSSTKRRNCSDLALETDRLIDASADREIQFLTIN